MIDILLEIAKIGPVVAILVASLIYFIRRENKNELEIESLHKELRESEKENLTALLKVTGVLEKVMDSEKIGNEKVLNSIEEMRRSIEDKINNLK